MIKMEQEHAFNALKIKSRILYMIIFWIGNQGRDSRICAMCSEFLEMVINKVYFMFRNAAPLFIFYNYKRCAESCIYQYEKNNKIENKFM